MLKQEKERLPENSPFFNKALLGKWCWRFGAKAKGLWKTIINLKYGS